MYNLDNLGFSVMVFDFVFYLDYFRYLLQASFSRYDQILHFLTQNLHQTCFIDFSNVKWRMKQTSI